MRRAIHALLPFLSGRSRPGPGLSPLSLLAALGLVAAFGLLALPAGAAAEEAAAGSRAEQLLELSGLETQLESVDEQVRAGLSREDVPLDADDRRAAARVASERFAAPELRAAVLDQLEARMDPWHARAAISWLRSEPGRRITRAEEAVASAEGQRRMRAWVQSVGEDEVPRARLELARRLDDALGATELAVELSFGVALAMASGANAAQPPERRADPSRIVSAVEERHAELRRRLERDTIKQILYAYRDVPRVELERYITFLRSPEGRWYNRTMNAAVERALTRASLGFGEDLASRLQPAPAAPAAPAEPAAQR